MNQKSKSKSKNLQFSYFLVQTLQCTETFNNFVFVLPMKISKKPPALTAQFVQNKKDTKFIRVFLVLEIYNFGYYLLPCLRTEKKVEIEMMLAESPWPNCPLLSKNYWEFRSEFCSNLLFSRRVKSDLVSGYFDQNTTVIVSLYRRNS